MDASSVLAFATEFNRTSIKDIASGHPALLNDLRSLSPVQTAAIFAGLLARPELEANCLRLVALVHFAMLYCEGSKAPTKGLIRRAFDGLEEGYCGRAEDPSEDVFVALMNTPQGNFRVFEGIREGNAFHLQRILNLVESMPPVEPYDRLRASIEDLLKISEAVAQRAGVRENVLGQELPLKNLPANLVADLSSLRGLVKFSEEDLNHLQVQRESLAEFVFDPEQRLRLEGQTFGHTDLERCPLAFIGETTYVLLPTAIGSAITRLVVEFVISTGRADAFERALATEFAHVFRDTPLLGTGMPVRFQRIEGGRIGALMKEVGSGRFLHLVFFVDGLDEFFEGGVCGLNAVPEGLASALSLLVHRAADEAKAKAGFIDGLTLLIGCGYGSWAATDSSRQFSGRSPSSAIRNPRPGDIELVVSF